MADILTTIARPSAAAQQVLAARVTLEDALRLKGLPERLAECSQRLATARAAAAPFVAVRTTLGEAGAALARASERARAACAAFAATARDALDDLDDARDLLAAGAAAAACASLAASRRRAKGVATAARDVALELEAAATKVGEAETTARNLQQIQKEAARIQESKCADARASLVEARDRRALAEAAIGEAHALYEEAARRERSAVTRANLVHAAQLAAVVGAAAGARSPRLAVLGATGVGALCKAADGAILRAREEKAVFLAQKMKARERQLDVAKTIEGIAATLRTVREEAVVDTQALEALAKVVEGLRILSAAFLEAETFWVRVRAFTEANEGAAVEQIVVEGKEMRAEEQVALWGSKNFRRRMEAAYAHWMALKIMCEECVGGMDEVRKVLYEHIAKADTDSRTGSV